MISHHFIRRIVMFGILTPPPPKTDVPTSTYIAKNWMKYNVLVLLLLFFFSLSCRRSLFTVRGNFFFIGRRWIGFAAPSPVAHPMARWIVYSTFLLSTVCLGSCARCRGLLLCEHWIETIERVITFGRMHAADISQKHMLCERFAFFFPG